MKTLRIGIVGAGTAGSAAALYLARAGHDVTVFERVPEPAAVGAGILLQPTGMHVLARLGLLDRVLARGARVERLHATNARGFPVLDVRYGLLHPELFGLGLHRGVLFEALFGALGSSGVRVRTGVAIERFVREGGASVLVDENGTKQGAFELVVVADGARSHVRDSAGLPFEAPEYPWGALWFVAEDPAERVRGELRQFVDGTGTMFGLLPTGRGPDGKGPLVSLFWSERVDRMDAFRRGDTDHWKRRVRALAPEAEPVLEQIRSLEDLLTATYRDVRMPRWHGDGVVVIGDAAHATSPQLGQGCTLALVDALILADALDRASNVAEALAAYTRRRRPHLRFYQRASRWLTPLFQGDLEFLAPFRDYGMGLASKLPFARTQMVASMAGVKAGFVAGRLALPRTADVPALPAGVREG